MDINVSTLYDNAAQQYDDLLVKQRFGAPARDLATLLPISAATKVLDIGTGTGAFLFSALEKASPNTMVIGLDPSEEMLAVAQRKGAPLLIKGNLPDLPFLDETFDMVSACFVLSHLENYRSGLMEIKRILKPGGIFGCTSWREGQAEYNKIWNAVLKLFIHSRRIEELLAGSIHWEEWFEKADHIRDSFSEAGFTDIVIHHKEYYVPMTLEDYLNCRYTLLTGQFVRKTLSSELWEIFKDKMYSEFSNVCGEEITFRSRVHITLAYKL